jgi:hypothetical protein
MLSQASRLTMTFQTISIAIKAGEHWKIKAVAGVPLTNFLFFYFTWE